jgi:hypothetical protein
MSIKKREPKILVWDVETSPVKAWIWRTGSKINVSHDQIVDGQQTDIICICYKWHGQNKVHSLDWGVKKQDSSKMIEEFTKVVEQADIVLAHNGDRFDMKHFNTQRLLKGQPPIAWPTSEDTLKMVRKHFNFTSNRLDYLSRTLVGGGKDRMTFRDWVDIVDYKSEKALKKMIKYCKKDVELLDKVFTKIKPYVDLKVNRSLIKNNNRLGCANCGSEETQKYGVITTRTGRYQKIKCKSCGHVYRHHKKIV